MDSLIYASLSHTHYYWYEVGMLKVPARLLHIDYCTIMFVNENLGASKRSERPQPNQGGNCRKSLGVRTKKLFMGNNWVIQCSLMVVLIA